MTDRSTMPLLGGLIGRQSLAGTPDEDFEFGMGRLISGFEALLREQDPKPGGRQVAAKRVTAAKPPVRSGERAAPRRAAASGPGGAAKPAAEKPAAEKPAAEKPAEAPAKAGTGSQTVGGRTRTAPAS